MLHRTRSAALAGLLTLLLGAPTAQAIQPVAESGIRAESARKLPSRPFLAPQLQAQPSLRLDAQRDTLLQARLAPFQQRYGGSWDVRWDERADRPNVVQGSGIALVPGRGNALKLQQFGLDREVDINLGLVAAKAREFIDSVPELLQTAGLELKLDAERSLVTGGDRPVWFVEFGQYHQGVRVEGAHVYVRVAQGNIVQFGAERVADVRISATPATTREAAFAQAWKELGFPAGTKIDEMVEAGALSIYPVLPAGDGVGERYRGMAGLGYEHVLAWRYVFRLPDDDTTFQVLVDAHSNRVLEVRNLTVNVSAKVSGGVYPTTNSDTEIVVDFPFAAVTNGGSKVTDALGIYDYSGGTATTALDGKYFRMVDSCGAISLSNSSDGNLALGSSAGTDCTTPGVGGAGNTHASRSGFYHLTNINTKGRSFFPSNTWLQSKVTANMNVNQTCNASWNGTALNFYKSGPSASDPSVLCSNTGEIAAVFLHEWGHGLDTNTGGEASEYGSGEAVGDTFAFLETRDSCIGQNFRPGRDCPNCVACTGVRDVGDFGVSAPPAKLASPANLANDAGINCDRLACPYLQQGIFPYQGPMGYEGHCESVIASSANWDLTQALVNRFGESGWSKMDRIWYASLTSSKSAYRITSGGTCNVNAQVDGCGATNWYTVYLAADDDDGNLANGTPNACRIWDAFSAHGIACGARPSCSGDAPDFSLGVTNSPQAVCAPATATFTLNVGTDLGFLNPVTLSASGNPAGSTATFSPNPVTPGNPATLSIGTAGVAADSSSTLTINGSASASPGHSTTAQLTIATAVPNAPAPAAPANGATGINSAAAVTLSWAAISGASGYSVEVATDSAFGNIIASQPGQAGTSWNVNGLQPSTTYYWRVRAANICGAGGNSAVYNFRTAALAGSCDENQSANVLLSNDVEGDNAGWTASGTPAWTVSTARPFSPTRSWLATDITTSSDQRLVSPAIALPTGQNPLTLSFQNDVNLEERTAGGCYDGGFVEVSTNDGSSWTPVTGAQLLTTPYTGAIQSGAGASIQAWCGTLAYRRTVVDLNSYAGQTVRLRFRVSTDTSEGDTPLGWFVDDIKVQGCQAAVPDSIFVDGFEE
ncbi:fibronectin type III domain-containing protein [Tahibacter harae]|uniref:Fibronectin type-III domain-containing protein n=1 Tax=Tahibacter harae TaxID=2963937 RepID=A0ABT1QLK0_9GAMM|nr:hypothetical protein [Tahibacter harae]MCQ4163406.1 hypothetical protein [Tahibacter harae]